VFGNAHINTFDSKTYTHYGQCDYTLVEVPMEGSYWKVIIQNEDYCDPRQACPKKLYIHMHGVEIVLGQKGANGFSAIVNSREIKKFPYTDSSKKIYIKVLVRETVN